MIVLLGLRFHSLRNINQFKTKNWRIRLNTINGKQRKRSGRRFRRGGQDAR